MAAPSSATHTAAVACGDAMLDLREPADSSRSAGHSQVALAWHICLRAFCGAGRERPGRCVQPPPCWAVSVAGRVTAARRWDGIPLWRRGAIPSRSKRTQCHVWHREGHTTRVRESLARGARRVSRRLLCHATYVASRAGLWRAPHLSPTYSFSPALHVSMQRPRSRSTRAMRAGNLWQSRLHGGASQRPSARTRGCRRAIP